MILQTMTTRIERENTEKMFQNLDNVQKVKVVSRAPSLGEHVNWSTLTGVLLAIIKPPAYLDVVGCP